MPYFGGMYVENYVVEEWNRHHDEQGEFSHMRQAHKITQLLNEKLGFSVIHVAAYVGVDVSILEAFDSRLASAINAEAPNMAEMIIGRYGLNRDKSKF